MNPELERKVEMARERINNAREFNWEGGFAQHFFEDWLRTALQDAYELGRKDVADRARMEIQRSVVAENDTTCYLAISKDSPALKD
jgi:hypothetical protein